MVFQASQLELEDFNDNITYGHITLNLSPSATRDMQCFDDHVYFKMRKHGIEHEITAPYTALMIIQDPDDPMLSMPWPYFMDHGDDYIPDEPTTPSNVVYLPNSGVKVELRVPTLEDLNKMNLDNVIHFPGGSAHVGEEIQMERPLTLVERIEQRGWTVIEGGNRRPEASMPFIDEVYRAKLAKRESAAKLAKITMNDEVKLGEFEIRSDGSNGNSAYFPDLDVSKCRFPVGRMTRPVWLTVIEGGVRE